MRLLLKIVIAALFVNAAVHVTRSTWRYFSFRDAVRQEAIFSMDRPPDEVHRRILRHAIELQVPIEGTDILVQREDTHTLVQVVYADAIQIVPRFYTYTHTYDASVDVRARRPLPLTDIR
jgi:hypothetical protein